MADGPHNLTTWSPSPKQLDLLNVAKEAGLKRSIRALCRRAGVSRESFYAWMRADPGFRAAWEASWREAVDHHFPSSIAALSRRAQEGEVAAIRLMAEIKGVITKRIEHSGPGGGPVTTLDLSKLSRVQLQALIVLDPKVEDEINRSVIDTTARPVPQLPAPADPKPEGGSGE